MKEITGKQNIFCQLVAEGNTYAEAYRKAYPTSKKWKDTSVWCESSKLMTHTMVLHRVQDLQNITAERNQASLQEVLHKLATWIRFNPKTVIKPDGSMKSFQKMTDEEAECIQDFQIEEIWGGRGDDRKQIGVIKKVKLIDKRAVSDQFLRHFGAYLTKVSIEKEDLSHLEDLLKDIID